jgi:hypothetical protein
MKRYGLIGQVSMMILFAVMTVIMCVVLLTYALYLHSEPRLARDMPFLTGLTAWFAGAWALFGLGSWAYWAQQPWRWLWWLPQGAVLWGLWGMIRSLQNVG